MSQFVADPAIREHLHTTQRRLDDESEHVGLADMSMLEVVDAFWPAADGWEVVSVETGFHYVTSVVEHDDLGIGISLIGAASVTAAYSRGSVQSWEGLRIYDRRVHVRGAMHAQSPNRAALVAALAAIYESAMPQTVAARALACAVMSSPEVMDPTAQMLVALSGTALLAPAEKFRADAAARDVALPPLVVRCYA